MKLRKLLSGFMAAAIAVTSLCVTSIPAGAEIITLDDTGKVIDSYSENYIFQTDENKAVFSSLAYDGTEYIIVTYKEASILNSNGDKYSQFQFKDNNWALIQQVDVGAVSDYITFAYPLTSSWNVIKDEFLVIQGWNLDIKNVSIADDCTVNDLSITGNVERWADEADAAGKTSYFHAPASKFTGLAFDGSEYLLINGKAVDASNGWQQAKFVIADENQGNYKAIAGAQFDFRAEENSIYYVVPLTADLSDLAVDGLGVQGHNAEIASVKVLAPTKRSVTVSSAANGTVTTDKATAAYGDTVTITATPSEGYVFESLTVKDADNAAVSATPVTSSNVTKYTFTMPRKAVTVTATFAEDTTTTDPGETDPGNTDPGNTDPGNTDPGETDPGETEKPGETDPGETEKPDTPADKPEEEKPSTPNIPSIPSYPSGYSPSQPGEMKGSAYENNNSSSSTGSTGNTVSETKKPEETAPVVKVTDSAKGKATVTWTAHAGAKGYFVEEKQEDGSWKRIQTINKASESELDLKDLEPGTTTELRIVPFTVKGGKKVAVKNAEKEVSVTMAPKTVAKVKAAVDGRSVKLNWGSIGNAEGVQILKKDSKGVWRTEKTLKNPKAKGMTLNAKSGKQTYGVRTFTLDKNGKKVYSKVKKVTVKVPRQ